MNVTVPEDFSDITIRQYQNLIKAWDSTEDTREAALKTICACCDLEMDLVKNASWSDIEKIVDMVTWLFETPDPTKLDLPLQNRFTLNEVTYGFIPDRTKLSLGEFADLETFSAKGAYQNLECIIALVYRPIKEDKGYEYSIEDYAPSEKKNKIMLDCPMDVAVSAMLFFCRIGEALVKDTPPSLRPTEMRVR